MSWVTVAVALLFASGITSGIWEAVRALRHLSVQQAAMVRLLIRLEERLGTPEEYGKAHWQELERLQSKNRALDAHLWQAAAE